MVPTNPLREATENLPLPAEGFIGRYTLDHLLVDGKVGKLYRGTDKYGDHDIVLQFVGPALLPDRKAFRNLQRHVRDVSWIWGVNVARVFGLRQVQDFTFLIEAYVGRSNVEDLVSGGGPRPTRQALFMGRQMADALALIHRKGMLHLHLKASGVLLGDDGLCKVTGLGLSPFYDRRSPLFALDEGPVTPNRGSDLADLGRILHLLLTGEEEAPPEADYEGADRIAPLVGELLAPDVEARFPETELVSQRLDELLLDFGGQPEIYPRQSRGKALSASSPAVENALPPLDDLDDPLPPSLNRIPSPPPPPPPSDDTGDFDEAFEEEPEEGADLTDSTDSVMGFIRNRAEATIEREEWEAAKRAKRVSRMTAIGILFILFWLAVAVQFGPDSWRREGRLLVQHFLKRSGLMETKRP